MSNYKLWNNILAWITFAVAAFTYLSTIEPTASFWDCGEFIATIDKLLVGHPPGAPFFVLIGKFFTLFASGSDKIAMWVNVMSGLCSAFTILFLFWTITHLSRKLLVGNDLKSLTKGQSIGVLGAGLVGALAYTFTDSFWFSAVEGEVYAMSSLFTAAVFWAILKWDAESEKPHATRWIILIGYLIGLSIGVHLLNLLAIPAIALVYYFRKYTPTIKGAIITLAVSFALLLFIMYGVVPGTVRLASLFELMFVNGFGLPYNSGMITFYILLAAALIFGIYYSLKKSKFKLNLALTFLTVILIGYSAFTIVLIRANAEPTMNQNDPKDAFSLYSYLNREQYGDRPLVYGQYYSAPIVDIKTDGNIRAQRNGKYEIIDQSPKLVYDKRFETIFPRMYSTEGRHVSGYKSWARIKGTPIKTNQGVKTKPTFAENIRYFVSYQMNFMYWRYFMWNFAGRQNNQQGYTPGLTGGWISGIKFLDDWRIGGDSSLLPDSIKNDPSRNTYYLLPLLLGLAGIIYQIKKGKKNGYENLMLVGILFVLTGIAIVVYLNQKPMEPRERDYAYAASFYAFCIWIGIGVLFLSELFNKVVKSEYAAIIASVVGLIIPGILANQNWDDHDRSGRYLCRDVANNYLESCPKDAILFTNGDNDTFPLWYAQEVEGIRTDVRVCNLSYLQTGWYINQMRKQAYQSEALPFSLTKDRTGEDNRSYLMIDRLNGKAANLKAALDFLKSDNKRTKARQGMQEVDFLPAKKFTIPIDKQEVLNKGIVAPQDSNRIASSLDFNYSSKNSIAKNEMMILDLISTNDWNRPICMAVTVPSNYHLGNIGNHFELDGWAYKLTPVNTKYNSPYSGALRAKNAEINTEVMYDNVMNKFKFGGLNTKKLYLEPSSLGMCYKMRWDMVSLAGALRSEGKTDKAKAVIDKCWEEIPSYNVPYSLLDAYELLDLLIKLGMNDRAIELMNELHNKAKQDLPYYLSFGIKNKNLVNREIRENYGIYQYILRYSEKIDNELYQETLKELREFIPEVKKML